MILHRLVGGLLLAVFLSVVGFAQEDHPGAKVDLLQKIRSGSLDFSEADEALRQYRLAFVANPDGNWDTVQRTLATVFAQKQQFDLATELLKQGFDTQMLRNPEAAGRLLSAFEHAKGIAEYAPLSSNPQLGDEVLDSLIPHLRSKVASSGSPDVDSRVLVLAVALRSQTLPASDARQMIEGEFDRAKNLLAAHPSNYFASVTYIAALKSKAIPLYKGGQVDLALVDNLVSYATDLKQQNGLHKIVWGLEYCETIGFVIERLKDKYPDEAQRVLSSAVELLTQSGKDDEQFSTMFEFRVKKLRSMESEIATIRSDSSLLGKPAPDFDAAAWLNGQPTTIEDLKGKIVLLDFTAVWCGPCIEQLPELKALHHEFAEQGLVIISVTKQYNFTWDSEKGAPVESDVEVGLSGQVELLGKFVQQHEIPFPVMIVKADSEYCEQLGAKNIPHAVLIDKNGAVQMIRSGRTPANALDLKLQVEELILNPP